MMLSKMKALSCFFVLAALFAVPGWGADRKPVLPGTLNFLEGRVSLGDKALGPAAVGKAVLKPEQVLTTGERGYAEILLTPGVFVRVGTNSSLRMVTTGLVNTIVAVDRGRAMVEVDQISEDNNLRVAIGNVEVRLDKTGLYAFDADHGLAQTFKGHATAFTAQGEIGIKGGHELALATMKTSGFDEDACKSDDLYRFSRLRSQYASQANMDRRVVIAGGYYPGWYWNPYLGCYTFYPGAGYIYSPYGWGFYPYGWYGWGWGGRGYYGYRGRR